MNRDQPRTHPRTLTPGPSPAGRERGALGSLPPSGRRDRNEGGVAWCIRCGTAGFTLIELMVVMVLIALLLTIAVPRYFSTIDHGRAQVQRQNISAIRDAIDKYYGDQGKYPETLQDLVDKKYLRSVPVDPVTELPNWVIVPPTDPNLTGIYDIRSAKAPEGGSGATGS
jgi:general secretion pathway protein G